MNAASLRLAKLYMWTQKHYKHKEDERKAPGLRGYGFVPLSHSGTMLRELDYNNHGSQMPGILP